MGTDGEWEDWELVTEAGTYFDNPYSLIDKVRLYEKTEMLMSSDYKREIK